MVKSTSHLISEQCSYINRNNPNLKSKRKVHNILTEQIASLNSDNCVLGNVQGPSSTHAESSHSPTPPGDHVQVEDVVTPYPDSITGSINKVKDGASYGQSDTTTKSSLDNGGYIVLPPTPSELKKRRSGIKKKKTGVRNESRKKHTDDNFLQLLTGSALADNNIELDPVAKLKQQMSQSHVMKSLGGYKFLDSNVHDNFVVTILPKLENNKKDIRLSPDIFISFFPAGVTFSCQNLSFYSPSTPDQRTRIVNRSY